jgi:tetrahydromethanopterin S-methyltransferase subunit A
VSLKDGVQKLFRRHVLRRRSPTEWPFESGKYHVVDTSAPVVVVTPGQEALASDLAAFSVRGLCMTSAACRNATDIEKLVRNLESNRAINFLVLAAGNEAVSPGVEALRVLVGGEKGASEKAASLVHAVRGRLKALDVAGLEQRVKLVDMLDCADVDKIIATVNRLESTARRPDTGFVVQKHDTTLGIERVIAATDIVHVHTPDKAGRFTVRIEKQSIVLEHFNSKDELLRVIEGKTARDLYITLIRNGWVTKLDHAAYLGRELALAEAALRIGSSYAQDVAPGVSARAADEAY